MSPLTKVTLFANDLSKPKCPAGSSLVGLSAATARTVRSLTHSRLIYQASERLTTRAWRVEIEYKYLRAILEQLSNEVIAQEAGGSGQEIFLGGHFFETTNRRAGSTSLSTQAHRSSFYACAGLVGWSGGGFG